MKEMTDVVKQKFSSFFNSQTNLTVHTAEENKGGSCIQNEKSEKKALKHRHYLMRFEPN